MRRMRGDLAKPPGSVASATSALAVNAAHLAKLLKDSPYPSERENFAAGTMCRVGHRAGVLSIGPGGRAMCRTGCLMLSEYLIGGPLPWGFSTSWGSRS